MEQRGKLSQLYLGIEAGNKGSVLAHSQVRERFGGAECEG